MYVVDYRVHLLLYTVFTTDSLYVTNNIIFILFFLIEICINLIGSICNIEIGQRLMHEIEIHQKTEINSTVDVLLRR